MQDESYTSTHPLDHNRVCNGDTLPLPYLYMYRCVDNLEANNKLLLNKDDTSPSTVVSAQFESPRNGPCDGYTFRYSLPKYAWNYSKEVKKIRPSPVFLCPKNSG